MDIAKNKTFIFGLSLVVLFFVFTAIITYPLITNLTKGVLGPPPLEDHRIYLWEIDHFGKSIFFDFKNPLVAEDIFYPRGLHFQDMNFTLSAIIVSPLGYFLKNPTIAYNIWIFIGYVLSGIFAFLLANHLTRNKFASLLASLIFTFSPYHYQVVYNGELELSGIFWIPCLLYFFLLFLEKKSLRYAIFTSLIFSLTALSSGYYGVFSIITIAVFALLYFLFKKEEFIKWKNIGSKRAVKILFFLAILALIILTPFYLALYRSDRIITESGYNTFLNSFKYEMDGGVADIIDYITPLPFYY
ncbi:MAG: hypothetical protein COX35_01620, partial [Candidatus Nealsonbacteria bacterium CG23_combo_of_CG06-09_8_20_14_all_37_18]